jgi:hypothetical protein
VVPHVDLGLVDIQYEPALAREGVACAEFFGGIESGLIDVSDLFGVGESLSEKLIEAGFSTIPDIHHSPKWQLTLIDGVGDDTARALKSLAASRCDHHFGDYSWEPFKKYEPGIVQSSTPDSR